MSEDNKIKSYREDGFYWVLDGNDWTIALWSQNSHPRGWVDVIGNARFNRYDTDFDEIDECRITRTQNPKTDNSHSDGHLEHEFNIKSTGVFDEAWCSCGGWSESYMDGREYAREAWERHVSQSNAK